MAKLSLFAKAVGVLIVAAGCSQSEQAVAGPITIADQAALDAALGKARGGEVLQLAPGDYSVVLENRTFAKPVTITSADPSKPVNIGWHRLTNVTNLTFSRITMAREVQAGSNPNAENIGKVVDGTNITYDSVFFHGSLDGDATNDMDGLIVGGVENLKIINSRFQQLGRGALFGSINNLTVAHNIVREMRSDGFDFQTITHGVIENNSFSNFQRIGRDHPDAIQFWTNRTTRPTTDIVIRNNEIYQGDGSGMQGIFMRDEVTTLPFERITIENNIVIGSNMANGITVAHGKDIKILNNTVISPTDDDNPVWIRIEQVDGLTLTGNIADMRGNTTPDSAGINMKLLKTKNLPKLRPADVVVPGIGYQPPAQ